jgi:radical SAM-linked protein
MIRLRARLEKGEAARFISHLDLVRAIERALRRSGLPVAYSEGFNPHPKLTFSAPLSLGATSATEFLEIVLSEDITPDEFIAKLSAQLPLGLRVVEARPAPLHGTALMAALDTVTWEAAFPAPTGGRPAVAAAVEQLLKMGTYSIVHSGKHGDREIDLRSLIDRLEVLPDRSDVPAAGEVRLLMTLAMGQRGAVRPEEVVAALADLGHFGIERGEIELKRLAMTAGRGATSPWDIV